MHHSQRMSIEVERAGMHEEFGSHGQELKIYNS
jgi:hypothetical protein